MHEKKVYLSNEGVLSKVIEQFYQKVFCQRKYYHNGVFVVVHSMIPRKKNCLPVRGKGLHPRTINHPANIVVNL